jgi:hypothetical protein
LTRASTTCFDETRKTWMAGMNPAVTKITAT